MEPFLGEIRLFALNFVPTGWALCDGSILPILSYTGLFAVIGTTYGGNGVTSFALPDLRSRIIVGNVPAPIPPVPPPVPPPPPPPPSRWVVGAAGGSPVVSLLTSQMPAHTHALPTGTAGTAGTLPSPSSYLSPAPAGRRVAALYATPETQSGTAVTMAQGAAQLAGGSQPHNNMAPFLTLNYCIATVGMFPPRP